jgi:hypothetical protein
LSLLGRHLRRTRLAAFESALTPERNGGRVFPGVRIERRRFASRLIDELTSELVHVTRALA